MGWQAVWVVPNGLAWALKFGQQPYPYRRIALQKAGLFRYLLRADKKEIFVARVLGFAAHAGVKHITQGVADEVPAHDEEYQSQSGPDDDVPVGVQAGDPVTGK